MKSTATKTQLKKRLTRSLLGFAVFLVAFMTAIFLVRTGPQQDQAPSALRMGLEFNGRLAQKLFSESRQSVEVAPPTGKPRVNGDLGLRTPLNLSDYKVRVESGSRQLEIPLQDFAKLPYSKVSTLFKCIEGWSMPVEYEGYRFSDFMEALDLGKKPDGSFYKYVGLVTPDGQYYVSIDIESMRHAQTLLAIKMNESPLALENGAPIRLIIPIKYGIKSLKRVGLIFFSDVRPPDYWAERGYDWHSGL
ncbi:MAG TPA: molybdopterin-dependent oxidoreductase [Bdellovibrionales bacterium]|nr:molybdopterin-dependent oxidoreductase [Bdellovibrionales bacterium]